MEDMIICRCEGVHLSEIIKAMDHDAHAVPGVKKRVRAGMGYCQGRVCQPIIAEILHANTGNAIYQRAQAPVRPISMGDLIK